MNVFTSSPPLSQGDGKTEFANGLVGTGAKRDKRNPRASLVVHTPNRSYSKILFLAATAALAIFAGTGSVLATVATFAVILAAAGILFAAIAALAIFADASFALATFTAVLAATGFL